MASAITPREGSVPGLGRLLRRSPHSILVWGEDRRLVNQLVYHAARAIDPEFTWIEIAELGRDPLPGEPSVSGRIPPRRLMVVRAEHLRPRDDAGETPSEGAASRETRGPDLGLFRQLPAFVPPVLTGIFPSGGPRVLAVANADRIEAFYTTSGKLGARLMGLIATIGVSLVVGYCGPEREEFALWDSVLRLQMPEAGTAPDLRLYRGAKMLGWPGPEPWTLDLLTGFSEVQKELLLPATRGEWSPPSHPPASPPTPARAGAPRGDGSRQGRR